MLLLASFNPDGTITGPRDTTNYNNNIQSVDDKRYFPTQSNASILITSIPSNKFGNFIKPGSFTSNLKIYFGSTPTIETISISDDGQGNIIAKES